MWCGKPLTPGLQCVLNRANGHTLLALRQKEGRVVISPCCKILGVKNQGLFINEKGSDLAPLALPLPSICFPPFSITSAILTEFRSNCHISEIRSPVAKNRVNRVRSRKFVMPGIKRSKTKSSTGLGSLFFFHLLWGRSLRGLLNLALLVARTYSK